MNGKCQSPRQSFLKDDPDTLARTVLGESAGPPLHYACLGVNPTNIALPANVRKHGKRRATGSTRIEHDLKHPTHTIPSREEILGVFRDAKGPLDSSALVRALQVDPEAEGVLTRRLNAMERDGQLRANPAGQYALTDHSSFVSGRVSAHRDGFGFVIPDEPGADLFLPDKEMQKVLHGDRVLARIVGTDRRGRPEGSIVEVTERANTHVIGRLLSEN